MTPIEARFNDGMEFANRMKHGARPSYWGGYVAGLMRGLFGAQAVRNALHHVLSNRAAVGDEALGYRDGYEQIVMTTAFRDPGVEAWENEGGAMAQRREAPGVA